MNKILVICGFSCSGKDTLLNELVDNYNFKPIISTTTRPKRDCETNGVEYNFVDNKYFDNLIRNNNLLEYRIYHTLVNGIPDTWYYGTEKSNIDIENNKHIAILDYGGIKQFREYFGEDNIISIFLNIDEYTRKNRCIGRGDFDKNEWQRRYNDDLTKIKELSNNVDFVFNKIIPTNELSDIINHIYKILCNNV